MSKTYAVEGVVLKRVNFGEADRIVTIYSKEQGKITCIAKGVRKITSRKKGSLEPASQAKFFFARGKSLDILTQAELINSHSSARHNLTRVTQTYQILEIIDLLTVEEQANPNIYQLLIDSLLTFEHNGSKKTYLLGNIRQILQESGFTHDKIFTETELKNYIEELAEKKLRTKPFLTITPKLVELQ